MHLKRAGPEPAFQLPENGYLQASLACFENGLPPLPACFVVMAAGLLAGCVCDAAWLVGHASSVVRASRQSMRQAAALCMDKVQALLLRV